MIRFTRFMQWFCVVFFFFDFGVTVWHAVTGRWGWALFTLSMAVFMAAMWRVNGKTIERLESIKLEKELWQ